jgi:adenylosuccinate lyase
MPHKRNPILTERLCGLARVLRGYAQTAYENVALWHERDISHSGAERVVLPDATILLDYMQHLGERLVREMTVHAQRMRENLELTHGALYSQRALTALVESGVGRDAAYRIVQETAQRAWDEGTSFRALLIERINADAVPGVGDEKAAGIDWDGVFDPDAYLVHLPQVFERLQELQRS